MQSFVHPVSGKTVSGARLAPGAILVSSDLYDSSAGGWERCPVPGLALGISATQWVREREISLEARLLLAHLASQPTGTFTHIRNGLLVPFRDQSHDPRIDTPRVLQPQCIEELARYGYLSFDPSTQSYSLTVAGRAECAGHWPE